PAPRRILHSFPTRRSSDLNDVLDLGCGRGEFLEAARDAGLTARAIDQSEECIAICRAKGLDAERADLFEFLAALPDQSVGGTHRDRKSTCLNSSHVSISYA